jgi:hypothetical protein
MPKYRLPVLLFFLHSFRHSLPKPSVAADPAAEKAEEARDSLLSGERPAPRDSVLSGERPAPRDSILSGEWPASRDSLLSGERPAPRDSLLSGECPAPQEPLLSGEHPVDSRITDCCRGLGHSGRSVTSQ